MSISSSASPASATILIGSTRARGSRCKPIANALRSGRSPAATRRAVLADILSMLAIVNQCHIDDRWLIVDGKRATYRIHLGSGSILMGSTSQYLCIVADGGSDTARTVRLPFEGDTMLSIILSKAFMLADDDKITDRRILSQLRR